MILMMSLFFFKMEINDESFNHDLFFNKTCYKDLPTYNL